jgi:L-ascorbate metabolism protein UlaG (beta-lactamase superfamily)
MVWLGTAGVVVSDGKTGILIDPYVSRCGFFKVALGRPLQADVKAIRKWVDLFGENIRAVCVSHSHFDHCLDAPHFVRETGAWLIGSPSTLNVGRGAGLSEPSLKKINCNKSIEIGAFSLEFIESSHGPVFGGKVPYRGTIEHPLIPPCPADDFKEGQTFSILLSHPSGTIVHHGSAGFMPEMYKGKKADVVLLGVVGRGDTDVYLKNVPLELEAKLVIPIHFDNFFLPLKKNLNIMPGARLKEFFAVAGRYHKHFTLRVLPVGEKTAILPVPKDDHEKN